MSDNPLATRKDLPPPPRPERSTLGKEIIATTGQLIQESGLKATTLRAIAQRANVLAPQVYRHVGNMDELLSAAAIHLWDTYPTVRADAADPVRELQHAIETLIVFGLEHAELFLHISKPRGVEVSGLWKIQVDYLKDRIKQVAKSGRLRVGEVQAIEFIHPFCVGMILSCLHQTSRPSDASWLVWNAVRPLLHLEQSPTEGPQNAKAFANGLRASCSEIGALSLGERVLLREWLDRIASA